MSDAFKTREITARIRQSVRVSDRGGGVDVTFSAMGAPCRVYFGSRPPATVVDSLIAWVAGFEAKYSRYWPHSLICRINEAAGREWTAIDPEAEMIFGLCNELHFLSQGAFDPTALPLLRLWDWKQPKSTLPGDDEIATARKLVGWRLVQRRPGLIHLPLPGMALDLGGMGKEFAVDQVVLLLGSLGVRSALVDFGADVRVLGLPPDGRNAWRIGLEDPGNVGSCWATLAVRDAAVATSGDYRRNFERNGVRYGHIVDVRTGRPAVHGVRAASVLAPSCTQAGLLSTSALILGPDDGLRLLESTLGVAGALITENKKLISRRFHENLIT